MGEVVDIHVSEMIDGWMGDGGGMAIEREVRWIDGEMDNGKSRKEINMMLMGDNGDDG